MAARLSFSEIFNSPGLFKSLGFLVNLVFPRVGTINPVARSILFGYKINISVWAEVLHFTASYSMLFILILFIFRRKES